MTTTKKMIVWMWYKASAKNVKKESTPVKSCPTWDLRVLETFPQSTGD